MNGEEKGADLSMNLLFSLNHVISMRRRKRKMEKQITVERPQSYQIFQRDEKGMGSIQVKGRIKEEQRMKLEITLLDEEGKRLEGFVPVEVESSDGIFVGTITNVPAGLYQIQISGRVGADIKFQERVKDVGIGDLWIFAGQSNAAGHGRYIEGEAVDCPEDDLPMRGVNLWRYGNTAWCQAVQPVGELQEPSNHSPALTFAKEIQKAEHIPIGIIQVAVGGSCITSWVKGAEYYNRIFECLDSEYPKAKGVFWYQGESETIYTEEGDDPKEKVNLYIERFTKMVENLKKDLNNPRLTVITAQLNSQTDRVEEETPSSLWYQIKEIQRQLANPESAIYVPDTAVISTSDLAMSDVVHNSANSNVILAKRMARAALALAYNREIQWGQPNLKLAESEGRVVQLTFENVAGGLTASEQITDFTLRDEEGIVPVVQTEVCDNQVKLMVGRDFIGDVRVDGLASMRPEPTVWNERLEPVLGFYDIKVM